jgi:S1-C subfamily serine protease
LILDPKERATVSRVEKGSVAESAGLKPGDRIKSLAGQPLLSIADVQWVLHRTKAEGDNLLIQVERDGKAMELSLALPKGWRQLDDISWRASSWGLRRMVTGGMLLETLEGELPVGVAKDGMALRAKHVGQFGPHAAAKNAGFQVGDVIVAFDGKSDIKRESDWFAYALREKKTGEKVPVTVIRGGKKLELMLPMQD